MPFLEDAEKALETITGTSTPGASTVVFIEWLTGILQTALNSPNQHEQLQQTVNMLTAKKHDIAAAVASEPETTQAGAA